MGSVENKRWLTVDPGETTGWSLWHGETLLGGGQTPLWQFAHDVYDAVADDVGPLAQGNVEPLRETINPEQNTGAIELFVVEKFVLYPWEAKNLSWNEFRTSQLIGALTFIAALHTIELHKQPASIKERALAGGARELFVRPLHENRHQNDASMHGWFYVQVECKGLKVPVQDGVPYAPPPPPLSNAGAIG